MSLGKIPVHVATMAGHEHVLHVDYLSPRSSCGMCSTPVVSTTMSSLRREVAFQLGKSGPSSLKLLAGCVHLSDDDDLGDYLTVVGDPPALHLYLSVVDSNDIEDNYKELSRKGSASRQGDWAIVTECYDGRKEDEEYTDQTLYYLQTKEAVKSTHYKEAVGGIKPMGSKMRFYGGGKLAETDRDGHVIVYDLAGFLPHQGE